MGDKPFASDESWSSLLSSWFQSEEVGCGARELKSFSLITDIKEECLCIRLDQQTDARRVVLRLFGKGFKKNHKCLKSTKFPNRTFSNITKGWRLNFFWHGLLIFIKVSVVKRVSKRLPVVAPRLARCYAPPLPPLFCDTEFSSDLQRRLMENANLCIGLCGLPGSGKTVAVASAVSKLRQGLDRFDVAWCSCENRSDEDVMQDLCAGVPLNQEGKPVSNAVIVFDNCDRPIPIMKHLINSKFRKNSRVHVIVISTCPSVIIELGVRLEIMPRLGDEDARTILTRYSLMRGLEPPYTILDQVGGWMQAIVLAACVRTDSVADLVTVTNPRQVCESRSLMESLELIVAMIQVEKFSYELGSDQLLSDLATDSCSHLPPELRSHLFQMGFVQTANDPPRLFSSLERNLCADRCRKRGLAWILHLLAASTSPDPEL
eukprot:TRINITY_DN9730_c0_g1_i1.p1 TRINITY_DN9730_c0_g1~~TRINITY_DN9730_c0_g1_i1.p1  ORF type:complete len:433 (-),score=24.91 TRINITY_DN9730_c0_g1_i1:122-1420(-)